jgi:phosphatidylserine/phosphatidylglycerophosphate/cardiolipin synthase-like enzyme
MTNELFVPGSNCWRIERANKVAVIVDAADYFRIVRDAMLEAREQIIIVGWDVDPRILLDPENEGPDDDDSEDENGPNSLARFIPWLARRRPELRIQLLIWNMGALKMLTRGRAIFTLIHWRLSRHVDIRFDSSQPIGATHHQKIVVIDDSIAFCGGIDMTSDRWDTPEHEDGDPRRRLPGGRPYMPWHDTIGAVDGNAAAAIGELARDRWEKATGRSLPVPTRHTAPWPKRLRVLTENRQVAISRTIPRTAKCEEVREIETLYIDMIERAKRFIYADNQYFASRAVAEALAKRLQEPDGPEIVIVLPRSADGWLQEAVMGSARSELTAALYRLDQHDRLQFYTPVTKQGADIYVHSKLMIVDDRILRVGSSNMNNRSMGLDSECDIAIAPEDDHDLPDPAIRHLRETLLAEHLGTTPERVRAAFDSCGRLSDMIDGLSDDHPGGSKTLVPFEPAPVSETTLALGATEMLDPESVDERFEPLSNRGLFRGFLRRGTRGLFEQMRERRRLRRERNRGRWRRRFRKLMHRD